MDQLYTGYLAAPGFIEDLLAELKFKKIKHHSVHGDLVLCPASNAKIWWAQQVWDNVQIHSFKSISEATKLLKSKGRIWFNYSYQLHRRSQLIQQNLRSPAGKAFEFLGVRNLPGAGGWCLSSETEILLSESLSPAVANGQWSFKENKELPSRAYLKLWELFTVYPIRPSKGSLCLELGASPGGWTQVLVDMDCKILAVDRSPLAPSLMKNPAVIFKSGDAFSFLPQKVQQTFEKLDWLFSDLICTPEKLLPFVLEWLNQVEPPNFVCTLKFKGKVDFEIVQKFADIPGSEIRHLSHNKHELTWVRLRKNAVQQ